MLLGRSRHAPRSDRRRNRIRRGVAGLAALVTIGGAAPADAHPPESTSSSATVRHVAGVSAPEIGLIGDSTLSGVRWFEEYRALDRFDFVLDAESCRRTIERSCWSREQYRPRNALTALQDEAGDWGDVLVMMTGYNDSADGFADGVEAIVEEARRQGIGTVIWLSLRTKGVDYEEPLHLANGSTYRDANRSLYELADELDGFLQIADWATYSADSPEWFESDGAHLAPAGAEALTEFIAAQVRTVLAGGTVTPDPAPWEEVRDGDEGEHVVGVQLALIAAGFDEEVVADGDFGPQTAAAVAEFQRENALDESGAVDEETAAALGVYQPPATTTIVAATTTVVPASVTVTSTAVVVSGSAQEGVVSEVWWLALVLVPGVVWIARRREPSDPPASQAHGTADAGFDVADATDLMAEPVVQPSSGLLYDHTREHDDEMADP